ncbi:hypothetical protein CPB86DRAFT_781705 [Serendipita vermifera]|nr:hypothetical protein CPB86DRAFT_781705 [Serendipita vermifera]
MTYIQESHHFYLRVILSLNLGDVIVICYDPLEPQTLHNAIYRVRVNALSLYPKRRQDF